MRSKYYLMITGLVFTATAVLAGDENAALKKELSAPVVTSQPQIVNAQTQVVQPPQVVQQVPAQQVYQQAPSNSQPIYVIEKQPTTYVEDAPLKESKADQLRKSREDVERNTEERIVEKLESDRVRAEQERAKKILDVMEPKPEVKPEPVVQAPQPVVVVPPPPVAQVKEEVRVKEEIPKEEKKFNRVSMQALVGYSAYPSVQNVQSGTSFGAGLGYLLDPQLSLDLNFIYTRFNVDSANGAIYVDQNGFVYPLVTRMDQYNIEGDVKYRLLQDSKLSPYVGGIASYTIRNFSNGNIQYTNQVNNNSLSSWALDAGALAGVDLALSDKFKIGMDLRYLFNITYNLNNVPNRAYYFSNSNANGSAIESLSYYTFSVNGQLMF